MKFFKLLHQSSKCNARVGQIKTTRGLIQTPVFMPVGTLGTVKAVNQKDLKLDIGSEIILSNTYHLYLRPGTDIIKSSKGIHNYINWDRPILTDSGGYQIYSLSSKRDISDNGVKFKSHIDGSIHEFTPENIIDIQNIIGSDINMVLDECVSYKSNYSYAKESLKLTHSWLDRSIIQHNKIQDSYGHKQFLFPIVQGAFFDDLRKKSAEYISNCNLPGNAIGGLSVGEPKEKMYYFTDLVCQILPKDKPRYLMGVGTPENILECISLGCDMFDCVIPTRNGRNGMLFTSNGIINIKNTKWKTDFTPIDDKLNGHFSNDYSKAYLRHLIINREMLGSQIASMHNLKFYSWLICESRKKIIDGTFTSWKNKMVKKITQRL
tara:strand:- start:538 stop:1671 length:1134 start_codon:yes stop_codon:yes gene_type:complete